MSVGWRWRRGQIPHKFELRPVIKNERESGKERNEEEHTRERERERSDYTEKRERGIRD